MRLAFMRMPGWGIYSRRGSRIPPFFHRSPVGIQPVSILPRRYRHSSRSRPPSALASFARAWEAGSSACAGGGGPLVGPWWCRLAVRGRVGDTAAELASETSGFEDLGLMGLGIGIGIGTGPWEDLIELGGGL